MARFNFDTSQLIDDDAFSRAVSGNQAGQLITSASRAGSPKISVTTFGMSDILQGMGLFKSEEAIAFQYNQALSSELSAFIEDNGGLNETVPNAGIRTLLPYDILNKAAYASGAIDSMGGSGTPLPPGLVQGADGVRFTAADNLKPNTAAAREFIKANFKTGYTIGGYVYRTVAGTGKLSDHALGLALDVMVTKGGNRAEGTEKAMGDQIAAWFGTNPDVFGVSMIIWMDRKLNRKKKGWQPYSHPGGGGNTLQHRDHVHISFSDTGQSKAGAPGEPLL